MRKIIAVLALLLAGCGTNQPTEPTINTQPVNFPVTGSCVPDNLPTDDGYVDTDEALKAAPDAAERYVLLAMGRSQRAARLSLLEPVIEGCKKVHGAVTVGPNGSSVVKPD